MPDPIFRRTGRAAAWRVAASLVTGVLAMGACGSADSTGGAGTTSAPAASEATAPPKAATGTTGTVRPAGSLTDQHGVRYCEVLTIEVAESGTTAEVWGTQGLNDCPQADFESIDPAAVRDEMGVTVAMPNGPRYWVLDDIVAHRIAGSGEIHEFGGIAMRSIATVDLGKALPDRRPYVGISVQRDTEFAFDAGRTVYELTAPDGAIYVMQSYSLEIDPGLREEALASLAPRLTLPPGWTYASRVLTDILVVEDFDGIATVVQDDLRNSYQQRTMPNR